MSLTPLSRRLLIGLAAAGLTMGTLGLGAESGVAAPSACGSHCLSVVGVAHLPFAGARDNLSYSFTVTDRGTNATLKSFVIHSTRGLKCLNRKCDVTVNGVAVPYSHIKFSFDGSDATITVPTPIRGSGGHATARFTLGQAFTEKHPTRTTVKATSKSGQSATSRAVVTPYPTVDVAARNINDSGYDDPFVGNTKAINVRVPVVNEGTGKAPRARFTFPLGSGWRAKNTPGALGPAVSCKHAGATWTCDGQSPVDNSVGYQAITLVPAATARVNVVRNLYVHANTIGVTDQVPSNGNITLHVKDTGTADTGRALSVGSTKLTVGGTTTVTVVVLNRGPRTTRGLQVLVLHDGTRTSGHVALSSPKGPGLFQGYDRDGAGLEWIPPAIASGHRITATFNLRGKAAGTGWVSVTTRAVTYDPRTQGVALRSAAITVG